MKIDRNYINRIKDEIRDEDGCVFDEITLNGSAEQKIAVAELGYNLDELSLDEDPDVRISAVLNGANPLSMTKEEDKNVKFAVLRALENQMKEKKVLLFKTFDKYGELTYFVIPSKARRAVESMFSDEDETVRKLALSVLNWQRARDHYERFGECEDMDKELYLKKAHRKLQEGKLQPVPTCFELGFLEQFA